MRRARSKVEVVRDVEVQRARFSELSVYYSMNALFFTHLKQQDLFLHVTFSR